MKKLKIGVAGAHSTGKTSFCNLAVQFLEDMNLSLSVGRVPSFGSNAFKMGLPLLKEHDGMSTLWFIGKTICSEIELLLGHEVLLVDRPVVDAVGYLSAALKHRQVHDPLFEELKALAKAYASSYDLLYVTEIDESIPLGFGRDNDLNFRSLVASEIQNLVFNLPNTFHLRSDNTSDAIDQLSLLIKNSC